MTEAGSHPWLSGLFDDAETARLWSPEAQLAHMRAFEAAWSRAGPIAGLWSRDEGAAAAEAIERAEVDLQALRDGTARDGVCVPELVRQFKAAAGASVHRGATSQDVIDTATILCLVATLDLFEQRLNDLILSLSALEDRFGAVSIMGRTRMQAALPMLARTRLQSWSVPLDRHRTRLAALRPQISVVQIGGAVGDRASLGANAAEFSEAVATSLGLSAPPQAWHSARDGISEAASLLSLISGSLGKMGQDIALMAQQGVEEILLSGGGGSSAMPHKQNPVLAELLVTLARYNATLVAGMHQSLVHEQERSGAAWALEWLILPQMAQTTGCALGAARQVLARITRIGPA
ncbi:MAG: 3-carboxy-cis,cis-muconate cycloisomerase [Pseudomonadota bacterium]